MDFGDLYTQRLELDNAARVGVRWAAKHPTAWTNSASPADNTIEGQIIYAGDTREIPNSDSNITIEYLVYDKVAQTFTKCGQWSVSLAAFSPTGTYTRATCVIPGRFIRVTIAYNYPVLTPIFQSFYGLTILVRSQATMLEEV